MTPEEVAEELGMHIRHVRGFIRMHGLATQEDGTITREDFEDFRQRRNAATRDVKEALEHRHTGDPRPDWGW